jgi:hypothetical protein
MVDVVGDEERARSQVVLEERQHGGVEVLGTVEQNKVDLLGQVVCERLWSVTLAELERWRGVATITAGERRRDSTVMMAIRRSRTSAPGASSAGRWG